MSIEKTTYNTLQKPLLGISKIDFGLELPSEDSMADELSTVVGTDGMDPTSMRSQLRDHLLLHRAGGFLDNPIQKRKLTFSLDDTDDGAAMVFADESIGLPVAQTFLGFDNSGPLFDARHD